MSDSVQLTATGLRTAGIKGLVPITPTRPAIRAHDIAEKHTRRAAYNRKLTRSCCNVELFRRILSL